MWKNSSGSLIFVRKEWYPVRLYSGPIRFFAYPVKAIFTIANTSPIDYTLLKADFVLTRNNKELEIITKTIATKQAPLYSNQYNSLSTTVKFNKKFYTKRELENYTIKVYLYKDEKFKTEGVSLQVYESHDDIF